MTQKASIVGLSPEIDSEVEKMVVAFKERRDYAVEAINNIKGISVVKPDGAFYLFVNISEVEKDSMKFSKDLLEKKGVAVVPGIGFGSEGYIRISFATSLETIKDGINRIKDFVENR
jgi:aspartate aminotransferase